VSAEEEGEGGEGEGGEHGAEEGSWAAAAGGLDNLSATTLLLPAMGCISDTNSLINDSCRRWRSERGSATLFRACTTDFYYRYVQGFYKCYINFF
jgi:hypothetical protein